MALHQQLKQMKLQWYQDPNYVLGKQQYDQLRSRYSGVVDPAALLKIDLGAQDRQQTNKHRQHNTRKNNKDTNT